MSGQSSGKGGYGQSYGQPYGSQYGQSSYGYGYPGQQGSFFSAGGSARPSLPQSGYQTLPYQIPDSGIPQGGMPNPYQNGRMMDTGPQFGANFTGYGGPAGGSPYYNSAAQSAAQNAAMAANPLARGGIPSGAQIMAGGNPGMTNAGSAGPPSIFGSNVLQGGAATGAALNQYNGMNGGVPLSTQGVTQAQQNMGIGMTPGGTLSFAPSGNLNQISSSTAALMGARNNGQGQWVNSQGQVIGLV